MGFRLSPALRAHGLISRGVKAGGVNLSAIGGQVQPTFEPETANNLELGMKGRWWDGRLSASSAIYHTEVRDYQALTFEVEPVVFLNPRQVNLINIGEVRLQGVELEGRIEWPQGLSVHAGTAYTRAITLDFSNAPNENAPLMQKDLSGEPLYNAPRWTTAAGAEWCFSLRAPWDAVMALDYSYRSEHFGSVERGQGSEIDGYGLVDVRATLLQKSANLTVTASVRNVMDKDHVLAVGPLYGLGNYGATVGQERRFELRIRQTFN